MDIQDENDLIAAAGDWEEIQEILAAEVDSE